LIAGGDIIRSPVCFSIGVGQIVEADADSPSISMFDESGNQLPLTAQAFTHF